MGSMKPCWCHDDVQCPVCASKTFRLRYVVSNPFERKRQSIKLRHQNRRVGYNSGAYIVVHNDVGLPDRSLLRAVLNDEIWVLYIGRRQGALLERVQEFSGALTGSTKSTHGAGVLGRGLIGTEINPDAVRIVTIPYQDSWALEFRLLEDFSLNGGYYPRLNQKGPDRRSGSSKVVPMPNVRSLLGRGSKA